MDERERQEIEYRLREYLGHQEAARLAQIDREREDRRREDQRRDDQRREDERREEQRVREDRASEEMRRRG